MVNLQGVKEMGMVGSGAGAGAGNGGDTGVASAGNAMEIIEVLSRVLTQLIDLNKNITTKQHVITKFQSSYPPSITISAYLERINKYAKCSPNCFIVALIYIDRLIETRNVILSNLNVHRVLITSIMLATKVFDDEFYKNAYYAKLGGVSTQEMNSLELEFLSLMNFDFFVTVETFEKYQNELLSFTPPPVPITGSALDCPIDLSSPSPPALMNSGHLMGSLGQPSQVSGPSVAPPSLLQDVVSGEGSMAGLAGVVVPLAYDGSTGDFGTVTPPPLGGPSPQRQLYFPPNPSMELQQPLSYPGPTGGDTYSYPNSQPISQPHTYPQQQLMSGHFTKGYNQQPSGLYPGPGHYITPVTTPTSVAEAVFSWGSGDRDGSVCGAHGGGQQQQQMMRLNPQTQLFSPHYYQPSATSNPSNYPVPQQLQGQYPQAPPLSSPFNYGVPTQRLLQQQRGGCMQQQQVQHQQKSYFAPNPHPNLQQHHIPGHVGHYPQHGAAPQFSSPSHPMQQQRFVVAAGGGARGYWAAGG
jgi:hypothetical protein